MRQFLQRTVIYSLASVMVVHYYQNNVLLWNQKLNKMKELRKYADLKTFLIDLKNHNSKRNMMSVKSPKFVKTFSTNKICVMVFTRLLTWGSNPGKVSYSFMSVIKNYYAILYFVLNKNNQQFWMTTDHFLSGSFSIETFADDKKIKFLTSCQSLKFSDWECVLILTRSLHPKVRISLTAPSLLRILNVFFCG